MIYLASLHQETEDKLEGHYLVRTKEKLNEIVADTTQANRVIIRSDFALQYFTPRGLQAYIENAKYFNRSLTIELDEKANATTVENFVQKLSEARDINELIALAAMYPSEFKDAIGFLVQSSNSNNDELLSAANMVSRLQAEVEEKQEKIQELEYELKLEQDNKLDAMSKLDVLVKRINYQYDVGVDKSKLFKVENNRFDKILYIKECTRVQYMDSFLYYLKEILKILYKMPTRMVVIEPYYGTLSLQQYPTFTPHHRLKENDVVSGDILMLGLQPKLMADILKNASGISVLIILDRGKYSVPHIKGENVEYFYTASDLRDVPDDVPAKHIFSYSEKTLFIPYIQDFDSLDSSERLSKYSSMKSTQQIIKVIEGR